MGQPISAYRMETGLFELLGWPDSVDGTGRGLAALDEVIRWVLDSVPLAFWLIVILPTIWFFDLDIYLQVVGHP